MEFLHVLKPTAYNLDNQGTFFVLNLVSNRGSKQAGMRCNMIYEQTAKGPIQVQHADANLNIADIDTKCLDNMKHMHLTMLLLQHAV